MLPGVSEVGGRASPYADGIRIVKVGAWILLPWTV